MAHCIGRAAVVVVIAMLWQRRVMHYKQHWCTVVWPRLPDEMLHRCCWCCYCSLVVLSSNWWRDCPVLSLVVVKSRISSSVRCLDGGSTWLCRQRARLGPSAAASAVPCKRQARRGSREAQNLK